MVTNTARRWGSRQTELHTRNQKAETSSAASIDGPLSGQRVSSIKNDPLAGSCAHASRALMPSHITVSVHAFALKMASPLLHILLK